MGRDNLVGPDPTWESLPADVRELWIRDIDDFPPPPLLLELMDHDLQLDSYDPKRLASRVTGDSILTGRLLARANSAAMAPRTPITALGTALVHLGFNLVRSMVVNYQIEQSAQKLPGIVREHMLSIQRSTDNGAIIAYNWAREMREPDPAAIATRCLLGRLGTFLLARRFPAEMAEYFATSHEPQRLNFEANRFGVTSRSLTFKVAQRWGLPESLQFGVFHLWTPLFAEWEESGGCIACGGLALGFDPPQHMDDIEQWLSLRVHARLRENLEHHGALGRLSNVLDSTEYQTEMAATAEFGK